MSTAEVRTLDEAWRDVDINERGVAWREAVGGALHDTFHVGHPWSGCSFPDAVYDVWMPRFLLSLRAAGYDVAALDALTAALRSSDE